MKTIYRGIYSNILCFMALTVLPPLLSGCTEQDVTLPSGGSKGQEVALTLPIAVAPMEGTDAETRADDPKTAAEKTIKFLWMYQFDGPAANAKNVKCIGLYSNSTGMQGGNVTCSFSPAANGVQGVYLVANTQGINIAVGVDKRTAENQMTLFPLTKAIPALGLPMVGYQAFDPMLVSAAKPAPAFTLKATVVKIKYNCNLTAAGLGNYLTGTFTLKVKRITNGSTIWEQPVGAGVYTPPGLTRTAESTLGTVVVGNTIAGECYLSENLAGQKTGLAEKTRSLAKSPAEATYLELTGKTKDNKNVTFVYFLGAQGNHNDFNVVRNNVYNVTMKISGIFASDERITIK